MNARLFTLAVAVVLLITVSACAAVAPVPIVAAMDGIVNAELGNPSYINQGITWACDQVGGTMTEAGDCDYNLLGSFLGS